MYAETDDRIGEVSRYKTVPQQVGNRKPKHNSQFKIALALLASVFVLSSCSIHPPYPSLPDYDHCAPSGFCSGDLIFVRNLDPEGLDGAIASTTGEYTHVAIVEAGDSNDYVNLDSSLLIQPSHDYVIEALPGRGVIRRPMQEFLNEIYYSMPDTNYSILSYVTFMQLNLEANDVDVKQLMQRLHSLVGKPYDDAFMPNNDKYYCSELVYETFLDSHGRPIFESKPMNFSDSTGRIHPYWQSHFDSIGVPVPQNAPGTNPTDLSRSKLLFAFKIQ